MTKVFRYGAAMVGVVNTKRTQVQGTCELVDERKNCIYLYFAERTGLETGSCTSSAFTHLSMDLLIVFPF